MNDRDTCQEELPGEWNSTYHNSTYIHMHRREDSITLSFVRSDVETNEIDCHTENTLDIL